MEVSCVCSWQIVPHSILGRLRRGPLYNLTFTRVRLHTLLSWPLPCPVHRSHCCRYLVPRRHALAAKSSDPQVSLSHILSFPKRVAIERYTMMMETCSKVSQVGWLARYRILRFCPGILLLAWFLDGTPTPRRHGHLRSPAAAQENDSRPARRSGWTLDWTVHGNVGRAGEGRTYDQITQK